MEVVKQGSVSEPFYAEMNLNNLVLNVAILCVLLQLDLFVNLNFHSCITYLLTTWMKY